MLHVDVIVGKSAKPINTHKQRIIKNKKQKCKTHKFLRGSQLVIEYIHGSHQFTMLT